MPDHLGRNQLGAVLLIPSKSGVQLTEKGKELAYFLR